MSRTWLKSYFWLFIYVFKYLFKENVFIFELCVMRVVAVCLRVVCNSSGCCRQMAEACWVVEALDGVVETQGMMGT